MPLFLQNDTVFTGPALPEPFVRLQLEVELIRLGLLPRTVGEDGRVLAEFWRIYRAHLRLLVSQGGVLRVRNQAVEPLLTFGPFGYSTIEDAPDIATREGQESGGCFLLGRDGVRLRCWTAPLEEDLDAPARRGEAYRFSHARIASRVLLATGERLGLLTNGVELRLLICDAARLDTTITIALDSSWKREREVPDSFLLFIALACPKGVAALPDLLEKARLQQQKVTKDLRVQARMGVRDFIQAILDHPENRAPLDDLPDKDALAKALWHEGLVTVYRLLFILKVESTDDPAKALGFASGSLWRNTFSPTIALAPLVRAALDLGEATGTMLEEGLRNLFRLFSEGIECTEMTVRPMGGGLFDPATTPLLSRLSWGEVAVAQLLNHLLWTEPRRGATARERVHYGPLDVEDLGRVYEALLELEPGIASAPMCRLRRAKLEVVVSLAQGDRYRPARPIIAAEGGEDEEPLEEEIADKRAGTAITWIEEIPSGRYFLRAGLGRKASGSYYTPESFVRFLVQETLGPLVDSVSPRDNPHPSAILKLKVIDKAMGSGHFLVGAGRYLGDRLYEACRRCDELASEAERILEHAVLPEMEQAAYREQLETNRALLASLPDPDQEVVRYLPSRVSEGAENGYSQRKAVALCRRLIAVHCLYGVDRNPLAVELAKLSIWIECHAEGLPFTFLDHRLVLGDSLLGPSFEQLLRYPVSGELLDDLFTRELREKLTITLGNALVHVRELEASAGITMAEVEAKRAAKDRLDSALIPFKVLAAAWTGAVMLGSERARDTDYAALVRVVAESGTLPATIAGSSDAICLMVAKGFGLPCTPSSWPGLLAALSPSNLGKCIPALAFDFAFPEVFFPGARPVASGGFDAVLGNPPWDRIEVPEEEFWANYDLEVLSVDDKKARQPIILRIAERLPEAALAWSKCGENMGAQLRVHETLYRWQAVQLGGKTTTGRPDLYRLFAERSAQVLREGGVVGCVFPSAFHANEGATGIRQLYLEHMALRCCFSFENKRGLFEIHRSFKFAAVVAEKGGSTSSFDCGFYLHDDSWLFAERRQPATMCYALDFVRRTGGQLLSFAECRSQVDADLLSVLHAGGVVSLGDYLGGMGMELSYGVELHRNPDFNLPLSPPCFAAELDRGRNGVPPAEVPVVEGKAFNQYTDTGEYPVDVFAPLATVLRKSKWNPSMAYFRFAYREVASSTNVRTLICAILPSGIITNHKAAIETQPHLRKNASALALVGVLNSFFADWQVRQKAASTVSSFIFRTIKVPAALNCAAFLVHSALRLTCNHSGYSVLWREQLGDVWRETGAVFTWPAILGDDARWDVRASIDAIVAHVYGLSREQYAHVLGTFSHSDFPEMTSLCLGRFDELVHDGLEAFCRRHDPYHDIQLNESLPRPVIELPPQTVPMAVAEDSQGEFVLEDSPSATARRRGRRR